MSNRRHPERTALTDNQGLARFFLSGNSFGCIVDVMTPPSLLIL